MVEAKDTPTEEALREEYRERHVWLRHWNIEQRLVALAIVSLNGAALVNLRQLQGVLPACLLPILLVVVGIFGLIHNNRLCDRYDRNGKRLFEIARQLKIKAVFQEDRDTWPDYKGYEPKTMRAWFYLLYLATILLWIGIFAVHFN